MIFTDMTKVSGHAMVLTGYHNGKYSVINPCQVESIDFDLGYDKCEAGSGLRMRHQVEGPLGKYMWYW